MDGGGKQQQEWGGSLRVDQTAGAMNMTSLSRRTYSDLVMSQVPRLPAFDFSADGDGGRRRNRHHGGGPASPSSQKWPPPHQRSCSASMNDFHVDVVDGGSRRRSCSAASDGMQHVDAADGCDDRDRNRDYTLDCHDSSEGREQGLKPRSWSMRLVDHPDVKRRSRLANYRAISFQGKLKSSLARSFKWIKHHLAPPP